MEGWACLLLNEHHTENLKDDRDPEDSLVLVQPQDRQAQGVYEASSNDMTGL